MQAAEQRRDDAVEACALREAGGPAFGDESMRFRSEDEHRAGNASTRTREGKRLDDAPLHGHAGVPRRIGVVSDRSKTHPERAAEEQHVPEHGDEDGDDHTEMQPGVPGQQRKIRILGQPFGLLNLDRPRRLVGQQVLQQKAEELRSDDVHHDGAENLVDPCVGLQCAGNRTPDATADGAADQDQRDQENPWQVRQRKCHRRREDRADNDLSFTTDVDDPGSKGNTDAHADEQQRRRLDRGVCQLVPTTEGTVEQSRVARDRVGPKGQQHDRSDGERNRHRRERNSKRNERTDERGGPDAPDICARLRLAIKRPPVNGSIRFGEVNDS